MLFVHSMVFLTSGSKERGYILNACEELSRHPHEQRERIVVSEPGCHPQVEREGQKSEAVRRLNRPTGVHISYYDRPV